MEESGRELPPRSSASLSLSPFRRLPVGLRSSSSGGWTLIELIITVTVLTILSLGVVPLVKTSVKRAREQQLREALREMRNAIEEFHRDTIGATCCPAVPNSAGPPPPPTLDPRSKVGISDRTIFGVENPDHYPPKLETLVEGVSILPRANVIVGGNLNLNTNLGDKQPTNGGGGLVSTKKKTYLRAIPVDPMTGNADWGLRSTYDPPDASEWGGENVFDVYSKSDATALDGSKYSDW